MWIGTGTTISFGSGFVAEILDISGPGGSREVIDISHMGSSGAKEFKGGKLKDWGELTVEMAFAPKTTPPLGSEASSCVITWADSTVSVWTFNAFLTGYEVGAKLEDKATASVTLKVTGDITIT